MVPDVSAPMQIKNGELIMDADRAVLNAYDASAVEEALVLKEAHGGEVVVVSVGLAKAAVGSLRKALAMEPIRRCIFQRKVMRERMTWILLVML